MTATKKTISILNETNMANINKKGMGNDGLFLPPSRNAHMFYHRLCSRENKAINNDMINLEANLLNNGQRVVDND